MYSLRRLYAVVPLFVIGLSLGASGLVAASSANISHSYQSSTAFANGSLVSLDSAQDNRILAANTSTSNRLVGVVVGANDSLIAIDSETNLIQVATSGEANVLVSDVNGPVKSGDQIAVSPFSGIGMKSQPGARLIGLAQSSLTSANSGAVSKDVTDKDGKKQTLKVGFVRVSIAIGTAPIAGTETQQNALQKAAKMLTGHNVSTVRILISSFVAVVAIIALVTLIYTSVYGTLISIGRNPLAKASIFRALFSIIGLIVLTAAVALVTIYLIIR